MLALGVAATPLFGGPEDGVIGSAGLTMAAVLWLPQFVIGLTMGPMARSEDDPPPSE
ncbi:MULTISPECIES: hypothetical protein [unclassified Isoptericola]|uniref:hypothetical protein n=1 Tax=Isoptericola sp. NPDC057191 TaxID=3346041 RepID=UPI00362C5FD3